MADDSVRFSHYLPAAPKLELPSILPLKNQLESIAEANYAGEFHRRITELIQQFDAELDASHEVGIRLVNFGQTVVFHFRQLGYWNPSLIVFGGGLDDGTGVHLIQHVSQISILLQKLPLQDPTYRSHYRS